jgi:hypothetical protein
VSLSTTLIARRKIGIPRKRFSTTRSIRSARSRLLHRALRQHLAREPRGERVARLGDERLRVTVRLLDVRERVCDDE